MCFYEQRITILRQLETEGLLQAFRVSEETIDAQLPDWRWLSVAQSGLTLNALTDTVDTDASWHVIEMVIGKLKETPLRYSHARVSYQHVLELPGEFEDVIARARKHLIPGIGTTEVSVRDWALLADLDVACPEPAHGQMELGVARPFEIPMRLNRLAGRGPGMEHVGEREWSSQEFKRPALFADIDLTCKAQAGHEQSFLGDALIFWTTSRSHMSRLVRDLGSRLADEQDGGMG